MSDADLTSLELPADVVAAASGILLGLSGGLDSTVLLRLLASTPNPALPLRAIHVHHGLDPEADSWAAHCQAGCDQLGVVLRIVHVDVLRDSGMGREAAARAARHAAFAAELRDGEILALAHHRDDQAETFLLRALRASGPDGLAAMPPWRVHGNGWLWRPLLAQPRESLLAYARRHRLQWVEDPSNADASLDRNFLRQQLMPILRERWPQSSAAFARSAALCGEATALLEQEDARALHAARVDIDTLQVSTLLAQPAPRRARVLRRWCADLGLPPLPATGIARIEADLLQAAPDADAKFFWSGACVRRWRDLLHAGPVREPLPRDWAVDWDGSAPLPLPDGGELRLDGAARFDAPVRVHARQGGERIVLPGRDHSHALKHVLQDRNVPPWLRERLPLLSSADGLLLAAGDRAISAAFDTWLRDRNATLAWSP